MTLETTASITPATGTIAAMITPALLIMGSSSLVASALTRMARVVDRARWLAQTLETNDPKRAGVPLPILRGWLEGHGKRARFIARSIASLYAAVVVFVAACLSIALDRFSGGSLNWLPITLAVLGTLLLLTGGAWMVAESHLSDRQIQDEIRLALERSGAATAISRA
jgi:hypothetical protein